MQDISYEIKIYGEIAFSPIASYHLYIIHIFELCRRHDNIVLLTNLPKIISIIQLGILLSRDKTEMYGNE